MAKKDLSDVLRGVIRFGLLTFIEEAPPLVGPSREYRMALCRCDCGTVKAVQAAKLNRGDARSCGCMVVKAAQAANTKHGYHGKPAYISWRSMVSRCEYEGNKDFALYGGRGIRVCERWRGRFQAFLDDMGDRPSLDHSLDRVDVNGDYEPGNCRWATAIEQGNNRREHRHVTIGEETKTVAEWAVLSGIRYHTIISRLYAGWAPQAAVFEPIVGEDEKMRRAQEARWAGKRKAA